MGLSLAVRIRKFVAAEGVLRVIFATTMGVILGHTFLAIMFPGFLLKSTLNIVVWLGKHEDFAGNLIAAFVTIISATIAWVAVQRQIKVSTRKQDEALALTESLILEQIEAIAAVWSELDKQVSQPDRLSEVHYGIENSYRFKTVWFMFTNVLSEVKNDWVVAELSTYDKKKVQALNQNISSIISYKEKFIDDAIEADDFSGVQYIIREFSSFASFVDMVYPNLSHPLRGLRRAQTSHTTFSRELHEALAAMDGQVDLAKMLNLFRSPSDR